MIFRLPRFFILLFVLLVSSPLYAELIVFPAKGQSDEQMEQDKFFCYGWAKKQSKYDPVNAIPVTDTKPEATTPPQKRGGVLKGAVKGGAFGAIAGDSSEAAKRGAVAGGLIGALKQRRDKSKSSQQNTSSQATNDKTQIDKYHRAYSACLEGKGYTVK